MAFRCIILKGELQMREVKDDIRVSPAWRGWCREVLEQVRFWPDHEAIRKELVAHLEDGRADLERLGYPRSLAEERTLRAMGDAKEVGLALNRAHKPWLGWLWKVSQWLVILALAVCLLTSLAAVWNQQLPDVVSWLDPEPTYSEQEYVSQGWQSLNCPPPFRAGVYTIEAKQAFYYWDEELGRWYLSIDLRSRTLKFWLEGPALGRYLEAVDSNGVRYDWYQYPYVSGSGPNNGHFQNAMWISVNGIEGDPEWIDITHKTAEWTIRVELPRGEERTP